MNKQGGFTLMELLIGIVIVGILMAIALPAYQNYTTRAKLTEVILAASTCKTAVTEKVQAGDAFPAASGWGCEVASPTKYVDKVDVDANGAITVTVNATNLKGLSSDNTKTPVILFTPESKADTAMKAADAGTVSTVFAWTCGGNGTIDKKFLPSSCSAS